jgi:hypothetical protein
LLNTWAASTPHTNQYSLAHANFSILSAEITTVGYLRNIKYNSWRDLHQLVTLFKFNKGHQLKLNPLTQDQSEKKTVSTIGHFCQRKATIQEQSIGTATVMTPSKG